MLSNVLLLGFSIFAIIIGISIFFLIWNKPVLVVYTQIIYCCFMRFLISNLHFPEVIKFLSDFLTIILFIQILLQFNKTKTLNIRKPLFFIILFILTGTLSSLLNKSSIIFFIVGLRVYLKFFIFFLACTIFLTSRDLERIIKFLLAILPVNSIAAFYQFFIMGLRDDYIGGLFGIIQGCNGELNIYLTAIMIIVISYYINNKISLWYSVVSILQINVLAALSELKILYFTLILVLGILFILSFPNKKAIILLISCSLILVLGLFLLLIIYPKWNNLIANFGSYITETVGGAYGGENTLGRTVAGPYVFKNILIEPIQKLFGIGLGYGDRYLSMESSFYSRYSILKFYYFSYVVILIETGSIGLIVYCLFFASIMYESMRIKKIFKIGDIFYCHISLVVSIFVFLFILYDQSIFHDGAFIFFFILSLPFIMEKEAYENSLGRDV